MHYKAKDAILYYMKNAFQYTDFSYLFTGSLRTVDILIFKNEKQVS